MQSQLISLTDKLDGFVDAAQDALWPRWEHTRIASQQSNRLQQARL